jgi:hypothetical protein
MARLTRLSASASRSSSTEEATVQDILWLAVALAFFLFSGWFVAFSDRLMPAEQQQRSADTPSEQTDRGEVQV